MNEVSFIFTDKAPLGSNEFEMIELFRKLNVSRTVACTIACLAKGKEIPSQKIEKLTGLRQPEVSNAMRYLLENNWVEVREEKKLNGKGRPTKLYSLIVPISQIINAIEERILEDNRQVIRNIEFLKEISNEIIE